MAKGKHNDVLATGPCFGGGSIAFACDGRLLRVSSAHLSTAYRGAGVRSVGGATARAAALGTR